MYINMGELLEYKRRVYYLISSIKICIEMLMHTAQGRCVCVEMLQQGGPFQQGPKLGACLTLRNELSKE